MTADVAHFLERKLIKSVLLFPPVHSFYRLLIHKTVEEFPLLCSFSIGEGEDRRTVVCLQATILANFGEDHTQYVTESIEKVRRTVAMSQEHCDHRGYQENDSRDARPSSAGRSRGRGRGSAPAVAGPRSNNQPKKTVSKDGNRTSDSSNKPETSTDMKLEKDGRDAKTRPKISSGKSKRPDMQVYVPRGRRSRVRDEGREASVGRLAHGQDSGDKVDSNASDCATERFDDAHTDDHHGATGFTHDHSSSAHSIGSQRHSKKKSQESCSMRDSSTEKQATKRRRKKHAGHSTKETQSHQHKSSDTAQLAEGELDSLSVNQARDSQIEEEPAPTSDSSTRAWYEDDYDVETNGECLEEGNIGSSAIVIHSQEDLSKLGTDERESPGPSDSKIEDQLTSKENMESKTCDDSAANALHEQSISTDTSDVIADTISPGKESELHSSGLPVESNNTFQVLRENIDDIKEPASSNEILTKCENQEVVASIDQNDIDSHTEIPVESDINLESREATIPMDICEDSVGEVGAKPVCSSTESTDVPNQEDDLPSADTSEISNVNEDTNLPMTSPICVSDEAKPSPDDDIKAECANEEDDDDESWDKLFDDEGEALDPKLLEELTVAVGKVSVEKTQFDYYDFQPKESDLAYDDYGHLVEIYDFPSDFITRDLIMAFSEFMQKGFDIKWVDDTHAIGVFASPIAASSALKTKHPLLKVRPISEATRATKMKAKKCEEFVQPYKARPVTNASVARNLVAGALGLKSKVDREKQSQDRKSLREARDKKKMATRQKRDAWEGVLGKCAMDEES